MSLWLGEMITCLGFSVLSYLMDFSVDSDGEASLPEKNKISLLELVLVCVWAEKPHALRTAPEFLPGWQQRVLGSHLGPESRLDPSNPAERGELGLERRSSSCSGTATHWLVKIAWLLASVPGLASGFPKRLQHARPPSRQGLLEDTHMVRYGCRAVLIPSFLQHRVVVTALP